MSIRLATLVFALAAVVGCGPSAGDAPGPAAVVFVQAPTGISAAPAGRYPAGSRVVRLEPPEPGGALSVLSDGLQAAGSPAVSFDGRRVLFAGQRTAGANWQIWEVPASGGAPRQITRHAEDCADPVFLPGGQIAFAAVVPGAAAEGGSGPLWALFVCALDGCEPQRVTFNQSSDLGPTVMSDGRLLYTSWQRHGRPAMGALFSVHPDGTGVRPFYGNHSGAPAKLRPRQMADGDVVFVAWDGSSADGSGDLARVALRRPLHSLRRLSDGATRVRAAEPRPDGELIVSARPEGGETYGLYRWSDASEIPGAVLHDDPAMDELDPAWGGPRLRPQAHSSVLKPAAKTGWLYCMASHETDRAAGPAGPVDPGAVAKLRVFTAGGHTLGEAPVEPDGSFFIEVPADTPLALSTMGPDGKVLQTLQSWIWVRPNERRGCIGCHEDRERAPPNRVIDALSKPAVRIAAKAGGDDRP